MFEEYNYLQHFRCFLDVKGMFDEDVDCCIAVRWSCVRYSLRRRFCLWGVLCLPTKLSGVMIPQKFFDRRILKSCFLQPSFHGNCMSSYSLGMRNLLDNLFYNSFFAYVFFFVKNHRQVLLQEEEST